LFNVQRGYFPESLRPSSEMFHHSNWHKAGVIAADTPGRYFAKDLFVSAIHMRFSAAQRHQIEKHFQQFTHLA
jgi:hypothetical protein